MKKTSLADLAGELGVSKTLVSLVMNNKGDKNGISKKTQQKVFEKAKELNYKPNQFARGLRLGRSNTIGLIVADISNPFYASICRSIEDAASEHNYHLIICSTDENPDKENALIELFIDRHVDGMIIATTQNKPENFKILTESNIPFVLIDRDIPSFEANKVLVDNYKSTNKAIQLLIKNGRRKIAMLSISPSHLNPIKERVRGYKDTLKKNNIKVNSSWIREINFSMFEKTVKQEVGLPISTEVANATHVHEALKYGID